MEIKNMTVEEGAGTSNVIKEQYEKHEKFLGGFFFISSLFICKNKKGVARKDEKGNSRSRKCE